MKIFIVDDFKKRADSLSVMLQAKKHTITCCTSSNSFMDEMQKAKPDRIIMDIESWKKGRAIYSYLSFDRQLDDIPVTFYNSADENAAIANRQSNPADVVIVKPVNPEAIAESVS